VIPINSMSAEPGEQKLVFTRVFDAPRELVFKAWTDPKHLAQWWGPKDFTNPVCEVEARPGGIMRIHMRGPDGTMYPSKGIVQESVPPERFVFTNTALEDEAGVPQIATLNTVTFVEHNGKTRLTLQVVIVKASPAVAASLAGMNEGWNQSLDRLAQSLQPETGSGNNHQQEKEQRHPMNTVTSQDGTTIAFDQAGSGPALVLVDGAMCSRAFGPMAGLATQLAPHFTVYTYDRRGRGDSTDTQPYTVKREIEDIKALINEAGGTALVYGISSGAALALEAALQLPTKITKLAIYESPFSTDENVSRPPDDYVPHLSELISAGRRGDAAAYFMKVVGTPDEAIAGMRQSPVWPAFEAVAPTLVYDGIIMNGFSVPVERAATVKVPTLVMAGGASPAWMQQTAQMLADAIPGAQHATLAGQTHEVSAEVLAPVLTTFFAG
jgi:uncharacterized protein YndB with AHSA1/START domain/pimeloyl-ACP methyl ester carboxylesterase